MAPKGLTGRKTFYKKESPATKIAGLSRFQITGYPTKMPPWKPAKASNSKPTGGAAGFAMMVLP